MSESGVSEGVGKTALGVAMVRAEESRREDRLFDDPYAQLFLDAAPGVFDAEQNAARKRASSDMAAWGAAFWSHAVIRTRFFDDYLLDAVSRGVRQVVVLAAGLDTRAYRLDWPPGVRLFELDLPGVLSFKDEVLAKHAAEARCERMPVPGDLGGRWPERLLAAAFDRAQPAAWLAEGLLIYLSEEQATRLLTSVGELSASGSRLAMEHERLGNAEMRRRARSLPAEREYEELWKGGVTNTPAWLAAHGWQTHLHERMQVAAALGRPLSEPSSGGFLTAERD